MSRIIANTAYIIFDAASYVWSNIYFYIYVWPRMKKEIEKIEFATIVATAIKSKDKGDE